MLSLVLAAGVVRFREVNNVREHYSADNSPSRYEYAVQQDFSKDFGDPFHVVVGMQAADGGSLLRPKSDFVSVYHLLFRMIISVIFLKFINILEHSSRFSS